MPWFDGTDPAPECLPAFGKGGSEQLPESMGQAPKVVWRWLGSEKLGVLPWKETGRCSFLITETRYTLPLCIVSSVSSLMLVMLQHLPREETEKVFGLISLLQKQQTWSL